MKQQIENFLIENGFHKVDENTYEQQVQRQGQIVVINGVQQSTKGYMSVLRFSYIGEGWEGNSETDNNKLTQWQLLVDDNVSPEILVHDLDEFINGLTK